MFSRNILKLNCCTIISRKFNMEAFHKRQKQAEQTLTYLKEQLAILSQLSEQRKRQSEEEEIKRLSKENDRIRVEINKLRTDLKFCETQNGVKHVAVPCIKPTLTNQTTFPEPAGAQETPSVDKDGKQHEQNGKPQQKKQKKTPKEQSKKEGSSKQAKGGSGDVERPVDVSRLNLKVGKIINVKKHPDADTLYVEEVDLGEERTRTVVSGLVKHVTMEEMQDRVAIFCCNLKPQKMRGILSEGMIMCAATPEKSEIIEVPSSVSIGDRVTCDQYPGEPDVQLPPKKKIWEQVQPDLDINEDGIAGYKGSPFVVGGKQGQFRAPTLKKCSIR